MKHIISNEHSEKCPIHDNNKHMHYDYTKKTGRSVASLCYPKHYLFYAMNQFVLISVPECSCVYNDLNFYESLVKSIYKNAKKVKNKLLDNTYRSVCVKDFKDSSRINEIFYDIYYEVNHVYYNGAGKAYAIVTELSFADFINRDFIYDQYNKAKEELKRLGLYSQFDYKLNVLRNCNQPELDRDKVAQKSVENILLTIKSQLS
jgi:hypothetical protein